MEPPGKRGTSYSISSSAKGGICSGGIQTIFPSCQTTMLRPARRCSSKARATPRRTPIDRRNDDHVKHAIGAGYPATPYRWFDRGEPAIEDIVKMPEQAL